MSATLCYAVGPEHDKKGTLVVTIRGGRVTREVPVAAMGTPFGIVCGSGSSCVAVGGGINAVGGGPGTVVTVSNGSPGKVETTRTNYFLGVACPNATTCYAGASGGGYGVVVTLKRGIPGTPHKVAGTSQLGAVACANATTCLAVGGFESSSGRPSGALVKLTGGTPGKARLSGPANLSAVSCSTSGACVAVGTNNELTSGYLVTMRI